MYITRDPIFFHPAVHASSMDRLRRCLVAVCRGHGEEEQSKHVFRALGERQTLYARVKELLLPMCMFPILCIAVIIVWRRRPDATDQRLIVTERTQHIYDPACASNCSLKIYLRWRVALHSSPSRGCNGVEQCMTAFRTLIGNEVRLFRAAPDLNTFCTAGRWYVLSA